MVENINKSLISKIFWGVLALFLIVLLCRINVSTLSREQSETILSQKRVNYTKELNKTELEEFIALYPKFKEDMISIGADIDYIREYPEKANWSVKRWFMYKVWDMGRFFYVQKRISKALAVIEARKKAASIASQFENSEDETARKLYETQKEKVDDLGDFSLDELKLVTEKAEVLKKILE